MNEDMTSPQRIGRLTPLAELLAVIGEVEPVVPHDIGVATASGCVLATEIIASNDLPAKLVALRDGWAVDAETTRDAGGYAPVTLAPRRVDAFDALPQHADAVAPFDAATEVGGLLQIGVSVVPGDNVIPRGGEVEAGTTLCVAGRRLSASDVAVLAAAGVRSVAVRKPTILVTTARPGDPILDIVASFLMHAICAAGARAELSDNLGCALEAKAGDAIIVVGGTGTGRDDRTVVTLASVGRLICHGIAISPGETAAFGNSDGRPVLAVPGRIDSALACWLLLGRPLIHRLSGAQKDDAVVKALLTRKVASSIGVAEFVPLARAGEGVEPLASGHLPLQSLARANGWMLVPADSEGYPAGTEIEMRLLP